MDVKKRIEKAQAQLLKQLQPEARRQAEESPIVRLLAAAEQWRPRTGKWNRRGKVPCAG